MQISKITSFIFGINILAVLVGCVGGVENSSNDSSIPNEAPTVTVPASLTAADGSVEISIQVEDPEGGNLQFEWNTESGPSELQFSNERTQNPIVNAPMAGTYTVMVTVTDSGGAQSIQTVEVNVPSTDTFTIKTIIDEEGLMAGVTTHLVWKPLGLTLLTAQSDAQGEVIFEDLLGIPDDFTIIVE